MSTPPVVPLIYMIVVCTLALVLLAPRLIYDPLKPGLQHLKQR